MNKAIVQSPAIQSPAIFRPHNHRVATGLTIIGLVLGALFAGLPVLWMFAASFKSNQEIFAYPPRLIDESFSLASYIEVFTNPEQLRFFFNSYLVSGLVTIFTLIVGILAGYSFSRFAFR